MTNETNTNRQKEIHCWMPWLLTAAYCVTATAGLAVARWGGNISEGKHNEKVQRREYLQSVIENRTSGEYTSEQITSLERERESLMRDRSLGNLMQLVAPVSIIGPPFVLLWYVRPRKG